jgi:hypothetical protein
VDNRTTPAAQRTALTLAQARLSFFGGSYNPSPVGEVTLSEALESIRTGTYRPQIERLRLLLHHHGKPAYDQAKKHLPAVTFCGTFSPRRARDALTQHSGLVILDFDGVADVAQAKAVLCAGRCLAYVFISPSGMGLKAGLHIAPVADDAQYKHAWAFAASYVQHHTGLQADPSGTDVSRLCYLSVDPDAYVNFAADLLSIPPVVTAHPTQESRHSVPGMVVPPAHRPIPGMLGPRPAVEQRQQYLQQAIDRATKLITSSHPPTTTTPGNRHHSRLRAGRLLGGYVAGGFLPYEQAYQLLGQVVAQHTAHYERSMRTIASALTYGMRTPVTFEDLEQERLAWCANHGFIPRQ